MKQIIETYLAQRTYETNDVGDYMIDKFALIQYSNPDMKAGFLTIEFHKYKKTYTYSFSFYGFPQFMFTSSMESRIKLQDKFRTVY